MTRYPGARVALPWLFLIGATLVTYALAKTSALPVHYAVPLVMGIAAIKVRVVLLHYMELKHAPRAWRVVFELWLAVVTLVILGLWFFNGAPG